MNITSMSSISALGSNSQGVWDSYLDAQHCLKEQDFGKFSAFVSGLTAGQNHEIDVLRNSEQKYKQLDRSVLFGNVCSGQCSAAGGLER